MSKYLKLHEEIGHCYYIANNKMSQHLIQNHELVVCKYTILLSPSHLQPSILLPLLLLLQPRTLEWPTLRPAV